MTVPVNNQRSLQPYWSPELNDLASPDEANGGPHSRPHDHVAAAAQHERLHGLVHLKVGPPEPEDLLLGVADDEELAGQELNVPPVGGRRRKTDLGPATP